ncbi:GNAT family N-acetyltransferase [Spirosoma endbachense]|uniref:GNAT family N-acetyltransferase n=1 Tax=Spirosoma endbachense TaxID=2666025 RepID=A0A6P1VT48_9BACT|nr:GNAT family protein [Spirosoma endbachense]QHV96263.1 GNAT family N-acetyltransferase [Spirosoma endbachense]
MLTCRKAKPADARLYFDWANDPETRRQSFNTTPITLETHTTWFSRKLVSPDALLLVFENETSQAVGQVRFERIPIADMPDEIIVGVSVDVRFRGQGFASQIISQGCQSCKKQWGAITIHAYIRPDNQGSIRSFTKAGFKFSHESGKFGVPSFVYSKAV